MGIAARSDTRRVPRANLADTFSGILIDDPEDYLTAPDDDWELPSDEPYQVRRSFDPRILVPVLLVGALLGAGIGWLSADRGSNPEVQAVEDSSADGDAAAIEESGGASGPREPGSVDTLVGGAPTLDADAADDDTAGGQSTTTTTSTGVAAGDTSLPTEATTTTLFPADGSLIYYNDFSSGSLGPEWEQYNGAGNGGWGLRRPSALSIIDDAGSIAGGKCLALTARMGSGAEAGQLVSGGVKLLGYGQTYGRYTVRIRVEDDPSEVTSGVALLWPTSNLWPQDGEINIIENFYNRTTRFPVESRLHWMKPNSQPPFDRSDDALNQVDLQVDASDWHTYTLDWQPDVVTIAVDGGPPKILSGGDALIPRLPMDLTLQLDGLDKPDTGSQPVIDGEVTMCVDFVEVERP